jgi:hypothetical protein
MVTELVDINDRVLPISLVIDATEVLKTLNVRNNDLTIEELEVDV